MIRTRQSTTRENPVAEVPSVNAWSLPDFLNQPAVMQMVDRNSDLQKALAKTELADAIAEHLAAIDLSSAVLDSRRVTPGCLYICECLDADLRQRYIGEAIGLGATAAIVRDFGGLDTGSYSVFQDVPLIVLQDHVPVFMLSRLSLNEVGKAFYESRLVGKPVDVYGVTGTNGKTSCAWFLADVAENLSMRSGLVGTLGYGPIRNSDDSSGSSSVSGLQATGYTTPDAIEMQKILAELDAGGCRLVAIEVSSHGLVQGRVDAVDIKTAIFTNLSHDHLDYHGDMESYFFAKRKLFEKNSVEFAVINLDDPYAKRMIAALSPDVSYLTYSVSNEHADIHTRAVSYSLEGIQAEVATPYGPMQIAVALVGEFNLGNLLAVMAAFLLNGYQLAELREGLSRVSPPPGRMQMVGPAPISGQSSEREAGSADVSVIVDFAHTPDALQNVLATLRKHCERRLWCVFGCGGDRDRDKRPLMASIAERYSDRVIVTVDNSRSESKEQIVRDICSGFVSSAGHSVVMDRKEAVRQAVLEAQSGDLILLAGKGHEEFIVEAEKEIPFSDLLAAQEALRARMGVAA